MYRNKLHEVKESTVDGLKFFVSHHFRPPMQRLFKRLTFSHDGRPHQGFFQTFNFTFASENHHPREASPGNEPSQKDKTASTDNQARKKRRRDLEAKVYEWMKRIPREDELMDPNFYGADGVSDSKSEWLHAVTQSAWTRINRPEISTALGEGMADGWNRDLEDVVVKGGAWSDGDLPLVRDRALALRSMGRTGREQQRAESGREEQNRAEKSATTIAENTGAPANFVQAATDTLQTEALKMFVQGSIAPSVASQTPPPSSKSCSLPKRDEAERLSIWKRVTKRYSMLI
ncbi:hypothetical protein HOY82DRAFT_542636 [Tuber indicum]|nr:hypothetical protein HOY82DRAFT_542636 [Tuber indicum]